MKLGIWGYFIEWVASFQRWNCFTSIIGIYLESSMKNSCVEGLMIQNCIKWSLFAESTHFMITIVTIYRIVLERSSMQGTLCDWVCIVGDSFSLTISHGLVVLLSFLLCIGNRIVIEFRRLWNQSKCEQMKSSSMASLDDVWMIKRFAFPLFMSWYFALMNASFQFWSA